MSDRHTDNGGANTLLIVRHGQASYGAENYDVLSPLGIKQARRLGTWLAQRKIYLDAVWTGPLQRQADTARHLVEAAAEEGLRLPQPQVLDDLRERPAELLSMRIAPQLHQESFERLSNGLSIKEKAELKHQLVMDMWVRGQADIGELESFAAFEERALRAFKQIMDSAAAGQRVVAVTSAGLVSMAMRLALQLEPSSAMKLGFVTMNSGVTELSFHEQKPKLVSFNSVGHLEREDVSHI